MSVPVVVKHHTNAGGRPNLEWHACTAFIGAWRWVIRCNVPVAVDRPVSQQAPYEPRTCCPWACSSTSDICKHAAQQCCRCNACHTQRCPNAGQGLGVLGVQRSCCPGCATCTARCCCERQSLLVGCAFQELASQADAHPKPGARAWLVGVT